MDKIKQVTIAIALEALNANLLEAMKMEALLMTQKDVPLEIRYVDFTNAEIESKLTELRSVINEYMLAITELENYNGKTKPITNTPKEDDSNFTEYP